MFSCEYYKIFKDTYFEEHPRTAASVWEMTGPKLILTIELIHH